MNMATITQSQVTSDTEEVDPNQTTVLGDGDRDRSDMRSEAEKQGKSTGGQNPMQVDTFEGNVRYKDGLPQYKHSADRLAFVLAHYPAAGFPMTLAHLKSLSFLDELFWCLGVNSFQLWQIARLYALM